MLPTNSPLDFLAAFAIVFMSGVLLAMSITYCASRFHNGRNEMSDVLPSR